MADGGYQGKTGVFVQTSVINTFLWVLLCVDGSSGLLVSRCVQGGQIAILLGSNFFEVPSKRASQPLKTWGLLIKYRVLYNGYSGYATSNAARSPPSAALAKSIFLVPSEAALVWSSRVGVPQA
jgi:hypothetical protein